MDPSYGLYPGEGYMSQYGSPSASLHPTHHHLLDDMQPPIYSTGHLSEYHRSEYALRPPAQGGYMTGGESAYTSKGDSDTASASSRRKTSDYNETDEDSRSTRTASEGKKQNHSEIEKRRRDKMNTYITELSSMIPMCGAMSRKLDKLTVLRMAVQHLKNVHGAAHEFPEGRFKPDFLSEREMKMLILQAADGFLFVADCDRGRMLYVSESVNSALMYAQSELVGQSLFDILHPKDVAKVKEQLSSPESNSRERLIDAKTMLPVHAEVAQGAARFSPGARRSFFCRMKVKPGQREEVKREQPSGRLVDRKYCTIQCTGYLKAWPNSALNESGRGPSDDDGGPAGTLPCLVAIGRTVRALPRAPVRPAARKLQFVSRHAIDGKFLYVDQRVTAAVGYLPQELLGTSVYEYVAPAHVADIARAHKTALQARAPHSTPPYGFRKRDRCWASLQTNWRPFRNPWTKEVECLVAQNTILELYADPPPPPQAAADAYFPRDEHEMQATINSQLESHSLGAAIADAALRPPPAHCTADLPQDMLQDLPLYQSREGAGEESLLAGELCQVRNNVTLSDCAQPEIDDVLRVIATPPDAPEPPDGNDEAAMAVIMSLLEADAGLGGPVDFSGLPWPLP